jgi:dTDP-4-dehydrorhamnose reductase
MHRFDVADGAAALERLLDEGRYAYVLNAIAVLNAEIDPTSPASVARAVCVNARFPHVLADVAASRRCAVLHVSTDAVFSGLTAEQLSTEARVDPSDVYGMSKALGESRAPNVLNLRCSLVGRDRRGRGLTEWYLSRPTDGLVKGFTDYVWTPVTVSQFVDVVHAIVQSGRFRDLREAGAVLHVAPNPPLSKYHYLEALREAAGSGARIEPAVSPAGPCWRALRPSAVLEELVAAAEWPAAIRSMLGGDGQASLPSPES